MLSIFSNNFFFQKISRAAAYSKLNDFQNAIKDCEKAIEIDPKYAKAYGRMGYSYIEIFIYKFFVVVVSLTYFYVLLHLVWLMQVWNNMIKQFMLLKKQLN